MNSNIKDRIIFFGNFFSKDNIEQIIRKKLEKYSPEFAGLEEEKDIIPHLNWNIFGTFKRTKSSIELNKATISKTVRKSLKTSRKLLASKEKMIFIFPCFNPFVKEKLRGVNGFTPRANLIHLFLTQKYNEEMLEKITAHEFNHSVFLDCHNLIYTKLTLLDSLILEGLAQHFVVELFQEVNPWAKAVSLEKCKKVFPKIKRHLNTINYQVFSELFLKNNKYPLWTGYSLGYQVVKSFLQDTNESNWDKIMKLDSNYILEKSNWS